MGRKQSRITKLFDDLGQRVLARVDAVDVRTRSWFLRGSAVTVVVTILIAGVSLGLKRAEGFVHGLTQYDHPLVLDWIDLPDWLRLPENGHILDSLVARVDLRDTDRMLDPLLAARLGAALTATDAGWVRSIKHVHVRPDGVVAIRCQFRRPQAWIKQGACCFLIDDESIRLPGRYDAFDCKGTALMTITGVRGRPPEVGQKWAAADLAAGRKVVGLLSGRTFRGEIACVDVSNHDGRADRNHPHIELVTDAASARIWWGRPPEEERGMEISASQKVTLLETLFRQWGHLAMNRPYIDIRTWADRVAMPMAIPLMGQGRVIRG